MSTNGQHHDLLALPHGYLLNHLVIKSVIGRGGFGITYLAEDVHTRELVAVKEMIPPSVGVRSADYSISPVSESDRKEHQWATRSFLKEAETILKLKHPNFVRMYEFFEQNGTAYLVMPYIAGDHLKQLIEKNGPRPEHEVKSLLFPLIDAVKDMHHLGILHRDIKPNNIVINQNDRQPVLLDFGAARNYTADEHSGVTSLVSVGYTPIEQYSTNPEFQGPWSDIYSLAAVAYFMFTGKSPPDAAKRSQQLLRGETDPLIPLHRIPGVQISPSLSDALTHALQVNERERPQSIHEWMLILQPQPAPSPAARPPRLPYQPVAPQRPAQPRRAKKRSSNRPVIILLTVAIFLTISLGGIAIYLGQSQGTPSSSDSGLPSAIRTTPSSGGQPSSPSAPSRATTIKEFLQSFYRAEQSGDQLRYYADEVHYFGKTRDKSYIQNATQTYWKLWPNRKVEALNFDEVQTHKRQNITHVTAPYRAEVDNGVMTRIINRTNRLSITSINGQFYITSISNDYVRKDQVSFHQERQKASLRQHIENYLTAGNTGNGQAIRDQLRYLDQEVNPYYDDGRCNQAEITTILLKYDIAKPYRQFGISQVISYNGIGTEHPIISATVRHRTGTRYNISNGHKTYYYKFNYHGGKPYISAISTRPIR